MCEALFLCVFLDLCSERFMNLSVDLVTKIDSIGQALVTRTDSIKQVLVTQTVSISKARVPLPSHPKEHCVQLILEQTNFYIFNHACIFHIPFNNIHFTPPVIQVNRNMTLLPFKPTQHNIRPQRPINDVTFASEPTTVSL